MPTEPIKPVGELKEFNPSSGPVKPVGELQPFKSSQDKYQDILRDGSPSLYGDDDHLQKTKDIIDNIPEMNEGEKEILLGVAKMGKSKEEISNAIATLQGRHKKQDGG